MTGFCVQQTSLAKCSQSPKQKFQLGNLDQKSGTCCSGLRMYKSNDCWDAFVNGHLIQYSCDVSGGNLNQGYRMTGDGRIRKTLGNGMCVTADGPIRALVLRPCSELKDGEGVWEKT